MNDIVVVNPVQELPDFNCFACSPKHPFGLKLKFYQRGEKVIAKFDGREDLSGIPHILHGGLQATLMDEIMWWTVFQMKQRFCFSQDLQIEYKGVVRTDMELQLEGMVTGEQKNKIYTKGKLLHEGRTLVSANGTFFLPNEALFARMLKITPEEIPQDLKSFLQ